MIDCCVEIGHSYFDPSGTLIDPELFELQARIAAQLIGLLNERGFTHRAILLVDDEERAPRATSKALNEMLKIAPISPDLIVRESAMKLLYNETAKIADSNGAAKLRRSLESYKSPRGASACSHNAAFFQLLRLGAFANYPADNLLLLPNESDHKVYIPGTRIAVSVLAARFQATERRADRDIIRHCLPTFQHRLYRFFVDSLAKEDDSILAGQVMSALSPMLQPKEH